MARAIAVPPTPAVTPPTGEAHVAEPRELEVPTFKMSAKDWRWYLGVVFWYVLALAGSWWAFGAG